LDRVSSRPFGLLHVLELVALCFCANLLRLSNPERDCQLTPRIPAPRRLTAQSSRKERLVSWIHPELKRFTFHRVWTRVRPHQRQTLKDRKRDNRRAGRLAALLGISEARNIACPKTLICNGLFGLALSLSNDPLRNCQRRFRKPAAKPLAFTVDSYDSTLLLTQQLGCALNRPF